jgi:hypothetical protein
MSREHCCDVSDSRLNYSTVRVAAIWLGKARFPREEVTH